MTFYDRLKKGLVLFDGAMGTQIHNLNPTDAEWDGRNGCPEVLNLTVPDKIRQIHERYLAAGADVVETNTRSTAAPRRQRVAPPMHFPRLKSRDLSPAPSARAPSSSPWGRLISIPCMNHTPCRRAV